MPCLHKTAAATAVALFCLVTTTTASFSSSSASNVAIYWGQNSYMAATGAPNTQQRLSYYCSDTEVDIIPLAFLNVISDPSVNFANAGDNCTAFSGSTLLNCPQLEEDIQVCQSTYGKTIMLSVGGATYAEGGFSSSTAASSAADNIWAMFGPVQSGSTGNRPFGKAVIDGFDFDFESNSSNMAPFASELRSKMDAATAAGDKLYYLSAAPQCPYPDIADNDMLAGAVSFDFVMVQFYNNYCGLQSFVPHSSTQNNFDFSSWDNWAKTVSKNRNVRVLLGIPGSNTAAGSGYASGDSLTSIITYVKQFPSFGGIMMWDMSQVYANTGFLDQVIQDLSPRPSSTPATTANTTASVTGIATTSTEPGSSSAISPVLPSAPYVNSSTAQNTVTSFSPTTTVTISAITALAAKTTSPAQVPGNTERTTFSTVTRSAVTGGQAGGDGTGSRSIVAATTFLTVMSADQATAKSGTTLPTITTPAAQASIPLVRATTVKQWGQCGGISYTGSTRCESPFTCVQNSVWWAQCQ